MEDIKQYPKCNIIDSCSVNNIFCSEYFMRATLYSNFEFCTTPTIENELFSVTDYTFFSKENHDKLQQRYNEQKVNDKVKCISITIDDLMQLGELSPSLHQGEISCIALARKINLPIITDDKKALRESRRLLGSEEKAHNTPHLFGHLYYNKVVTDNEANKLKNDFVAFNRASIWVHYEKYINQAKSIATYEQC